MQNPAIAAALGRTRIIHIAFLITIPLFFNTLRSLHLAEQQVSTSMLVALSAICVADIGVALFLRRRYISASVERLRINPEDAAALNLQGHIISFAIAESVALFGFVLKFLGAGWNIVTVFFALGVFLLLAWTPKRDLPSQP